MQTPIENLIAPELARLILSKANGKRVWLVGGAIRDHFLALKQPDLDFAVETGAIHLARKVADALGVPCYVLDSIRDTARVIMPGQSTLDFAGLRASTIEEDLRLRDFTINASAVDLTEPARLIDPLGGLQDLKDSVLRACGEDSVSSDAIRALRAVRLSANLKFQLEDQTKQQVRDAGKALATCAAERKRDEFSKILEFNEVPTALRLMRRLNLLSAVVPELADLSTDAWEHTLQTTEQLTDLIAAVGKSFEPERAGNLTLAELSLRLGRYRKALEKYLDTSLRGGHRVIQILFLAATYAIFDDGAQAVASRARQLRYSEVEAARARNIVLNQDRASSLEGRANNLGIHRFFRACGEVGIEAALLYLALALASSPPQETMELKISTVRRLLEAWFDNYDRVVKPPRLLRGDELADALGLDEGPVIGKLLVSIAEGQVESSIQSRTDAIGLARNLLQERSQDS